MMNYRKALLFIGSILACLQINAQTPTTTINGKITDAAQKPLEGATVILLNEKDSSIAKTTISIDNGTFSFERIRYGNYKIDQRRRFYSF
jgi:uncharacterized surface anchored protein